MKMLLIFFTILLVQGPDYKGTILSVTDGDTFVLQTTEGNLKIRLNGIDAPEKDQPYGKESKVFLEQYLYKECMLKTYGVDRYGRTLGTLYVKGQNINLLSVQEGYSWHYKKYSKDEELAQAEEEARKGKRGLWKEGDAFAPWDWRKNKLQ